MSCHSDQSTIVSFIVHKNRISSSSMFSYMCCSGFEYKDRTTIHWDRFIWVQSNSCFSGTIEKEQNLREEENTSNYH